MQHFMEEIINEEPLRVKSKRYQVRGKTTPISVSLTKKDEDILNSFIDLATRLNVKLKINKRWTYSSMVKVCVRFAQKNLDQDNIKIIKNILLQLKDEDPRGKR